MPVFIEAITDPFAARRKQIMNLSGGPRDGAYPVRRPLRGIQIKEDSYAIIRVLDERGNFLPVFDAAGSRLYRSLVDGKAATTQWTNFLVSSVSEQREEKQQIVETFGDSYIFFFGESPRVLNVQGYLINSADFNWRAEWWENYERYFRGTRLVERASRLYLIYDDIIVEGYILNANASESAENNSLINFQFSMFVTGYSNISLVGDPNYPYPPGEIDYSQTTSYEQALNSFEGNRNLQMESTVDAVRRANQHGIYLGAAMLLADAIRRGMTSGDPSIFGFMQRAQAVMMGVTSLVDAIKGPGAFGIGPGGMGDQRSLPLRSRFSDNTDEFIGHPDWNISEFELASPFSKADMWRIADQTVDTSLADFFDPSGGEFWDLMGRAGRAAKEIAWRTANASAYLASDGSRASRLFTGPATATNPANSTAGVLRDIPFGMSVSVGVF